MFEEFITSAACWWLAAAVLFAVIEAATAGLTSIWFAGGAIGAMIGSLIGLPVLAQTAIFAAISILLIIATRPLARKHVNSKTVKTNADALIGEEGMAIISFNAGQPGQIRAGGTTWTAVCRECDVQKGEIVTILEINGVTLTVIPSTKLEEKEKEK